MPRKRKECAMQLIQIGQTDAPATVTVQEMFHRLANSEAEMIRAARERILAQDLQRVAAKTRRRRLN
jgi:hypothetical protein